MKKKSPINKYYYEPVEMVRDFKKIVTKNILNQTYKSRELIFWDNKSTDKSYQILSKIKDKKNKIFFSKKDYIALQS